MAVSFEFERSSSPILGVVRRPIAQVYCYSAAKHRWYEVWMIVDTGADYTLLPRYMMERLGVNLKDCRVFQTFGIGGKERAFFLNKLQVKLGEWKRDIPVGFLDRDDVPPLLGRHRFFETFLTTFSPTYTVTFADIK